MTIALRTKSRAWASRCIEAIGGSLIGLVDRQGERPIDGIPNEYKGEGNEASATGIFGSCSSL
jgi:hypothetical protein